MKHYLLSGILFYCILLPLLSSAQEHRTGITSAPNISQKKYDSTRSFRGGFAAVKLNNKWGFINQAGVEVIAPQYNVVSDFLEDNAVVFSDRWIMIDTFGHFIKNSYELQARRYISASVPQTPHDHKVPEINYDHAAKIVAAKATTASTCPPNIDFEDGNFNNWYCYKGLVTTVGGVNTINWANNNPPVNTPSNGRHTMINASTPSAVDPFGNFPINPPDGSGHAIKLGNDFVNDSAEKVRYVLTVPANAVDYSISFQYAVVLENPTNGTVHSADQKPRLMARVINAATNTVVQCADFLYVAAGTIPGFYNSTVDPNVKCKAWTPVFVNLSGYPGQTMYVEFTTADCTLGAHFGYGYLDVGPCSQPVITQYQCTPANSVTFTGPGDFQSYNWYNSDYTTVLGTSSTLVLNPPPPNGVVLHLELIPFNGTTCRDTLDVTVDSPLPVADAGPPKTICYGNAVQIGTPSVTGATYQWTPATGLSDPQAANPTSNATQTTQYILTVTSNNGCTAKDTTVVTVNPNPISDFTINNTDQCVGLNNYTFQNATSISSGTYTLAWNFGDGGTSNATDPTHVYAGAGTYTVTLTATSDQGCINIKTATVNVLPKPTVVSSPSASAQCLTGNSFTFNNNSTATVSPLSYAWTFGDGGNSSAATPTYTYATAGTYTVQLIVSTPAGCKDSIAYPVTVHPMPTADFTVNNSDQCISQNSFDFQNASSIAGGTYTLLWNFGDGGTSTATNPSHVYTTAGTYTVTLTTTSNNGCIDTHTTTINVLPKPTVIASAANPAQCLSGNSFSFSNGSTASVSPLSYAWTFGDGGTSTLATPAHTYSTPGTYNVQLIVSTPAGCKDSTLFSVTVHPIPVADFTINTATQCIGQNNFSFQNASSITAGSYTLTWNFGDGGNSTATDPTHVYTTPGTYTVTLTAISNFGCSNVKTATVNVLPKPTVTAAATNPSQCLTGNSFSFTNGSTASVSPLSYAWTFGDGGTSTLATPTHSYAAIGTYTVKLIVSTPAGCKDSISFSVNVNPMPVADFTVSNSSQCIAQNSFVFQNASSIAGGTYSLNWDFGDGGNSTATNPTHVYATPGTYTVTLTATSNNGCTNVKTTSINVVPKPTVVASSNTPSQCLAGNSFSFTNGSTASVSPLSYAWTFGDGGTSSLATPTHTYAAIGTYTVKLVVSTPAGCKDSISFPVNVNPMPIADFTVNNSSQCIAQNSFIFQNTSSIASGLYTLSWDFGDGGTSTSMSPTHIYATPGTYTVTMTATSNNGCTAVKTTTIQVLPKPTVVASVNVPSQCLAGNSFSFTNGSTASVSPLSYAWTFGDGGTSSLAMPVYSYGSAGIYNVKLVVSTPAGCKDSISFPVTVSPMPAADFTVNNASQCIAQNNFVFQNSTTVSSGTYTLEWDFGDGGTSTALNPSHVYATSGIYPVRLIAISNNGCRDTTIHTVQVFEKPIVSFTPNSPSQCFSNNSFSFTNNSSATVSPLSYNWSFGDGNFSTLASPTHQYAAAGTYIVKLVVTTPAGCKDSVTQTVNVLPEPTAFAGPDHHICPGTQINIGSAGITGNTYQWSPAIFLSSVQAAEPTLTPTQPVTYTLQVTGANGCIATDITDVFINAVPATDFTVSNPIQCISQNSFSFQNASSISAGTYTLHWDFGDGGNSNALNPTHVYATAGTYTVTLTATSNLGCVQTKTATVNVLEKPTVSFAPNNNIQCITNNNFIFTNNSTATVSPLSYAWTFGDGGTSTLASPSHQYASPGTYNVKLIVTTPAGCKDSSVFEVNVTAVPNALFSVPQPTQCAANNNFSFTNNTSFAEPLVWSWNFGDNTFSNQQNPTHSYAAPGIYTVTLTATSATGCTDTETHTVTVNAKPTVSFSPTAPAQCLRGNNTIFTNNSSITSGTLIYTWNFGDGTQSNAVSPTHVYAAAGVYDIVLIAVSNNGCIDSMHQTVTIRANPTISVNVSPSPNLCRGSTTTLNASGASSYTWTPAIGLSCTLCPSPTATAINNMTYVVTGLDNFNCPGTDTVRLNVMQPFRMQASGDSVCRGDSAGLHASGAATYLWTPSTGLNNDHIANPTAAPGTTTDYTVVGYDAANCFTDTAHIRLTVWPKPTLSFGADLTLPVGTQQTLTPIVTNGPIVSWLWAPSTYLSCNRCENPVATVTRDIDYSLTAVNDHGCSVKGIFRIRTFCPNSQVYIPDAFTPDGDGLNDVFMIRGKGITTVNYFRIFNRWGELIFEKTNFSPNNPAYGWDGKIRGIKGPPDVFVYTTEVVCDNGGKNIFKGNVTVLR